MAADLMKLVRSVLAQKRALDARERALIDSLNRALPDMGYRVVATSATPAPAPRGRGGPAGSSRRAASAAPKNLVCAECGRRFSHPLHLGRHNAAMHKPSRTKASAPKPSAARRRKPGKTRKAARKTG